METFKLGEKVQITLSHKSMVGVLVEEDDSGKYLIVKHDNFAGEVFKREQISKLNYDPELINILKSPILN